MFFVFTINFYLFQYFYSTLTGYIFMSLYGSEKIFNVSIQKTAGRILFPAAAYGTKSYFGRRFLYSATSISYSTTFSEE